MEGVFLSLKNWEFQQALWLLNFMPNSLGETTGEKTSPGDPTHPSTWQATTPSSKGHMAWHDMTWQFNTMQNIYIHMRILHILWPWLFPRPIQCDHQTDFRKKNSVSALPTTLLQTGHLAATFVWAACCRKRKAQTKQMTWPHCAVRMSSGSPRGGNQNFPPKKKPRTKEKTQRGHVFF